MLALIIILVVIVALVLFFSVFSYNGLVRLNQQVDEAWSDITVQLKRRYDLIPNLVNTVKGYASHEKTVFEDVSNARAQGLNASGVAETAAADNQFQKTMKSLFAVAENYPDLKASQNFQELQAELTDTEDKIQASRRFYNSTVRDFNIKRKTFPTKLFANMLHYDKDKEYFQDEEEAAQINQAPSVNF